MTTIPERIREEAQRLAGLINASNDEEVIAQALLAAEKRGREEERERCAKIADAFSAMQVTESDDERIGEVAFACFNEAASQRADMIAAAIRSTN